MQSTRFVVGDVVAYRNSFFEGEAIGVVSSEDVIDPRDTILHGHAFVFLRWISAPAHKSLYWNHSKGDFVAETKYLTKITHVEGI